MSWLAWMHSPSENEYRLSKELYYPCTEDFPWRLVQESGGWLADPDGRITYMSKKKPRRLWLNIKASRVNVDRETFIRTLISAIDNKTYELPRGWRVALEWRNKEDKPMKSGPFQDEMQKSARSSDGFDKAVSDWLKRKLRR